MPIQLQDPWQEKLEVTSVMYLFKILRKMYVIEMCINSTKFNE